jgi:hypothetical protein
MNHMRIDVAILTDPKYLRLKRALDGFTPPVIALELLVRLWGHCEAGRRGEEWPGADSDYIEMVCGWEGEPGKLTSLLTQPLGKIDPFIVLWEGGARIVGWSEANAGLCSAWSARKSKKTSFAVKLGDRAADTIGDRAADTIGDQRSALPRNGSSIGLGREGIVDLGKEGRKDRSSSKGGVDEPSRVSDQTNPMLGEIPSDEEIAAHAAQYRGNMAKGVPGPIPTDFVSYWQLTHLDRALRYPRGWRVAMELGWEHAYPLRKQRGGPKSQHYAPSQTADLLTQ